MKNLYSLFLLILALGFPFTASAQKAGKKPAPVTSPVSPKPAIPAHEAISAAQLGDVPLMNRLKGSQVQLQGKQVRTYRDTKAYRDFLVLTGPDFKLAGTRSGVEVLIRVPTSLRADKLPDLIDASGTLTDYESRPEGDGLLWMPVVTVSILK